MAIVLRLAASNALEGNVWSFDNNCLENLEHSNTTSSQISTNSYTLCYYIGNIQVLHEIMRRVINLRMNLELENNEGIVHIDM